MALLVWRRQATCFPDLCSGASTVCFSVKHGPSEPSLWPVALANAFLSCAAPLPLLRSLCSAEWPMANRLQMQGSCPRGQVGHAQVDPVQPCFCALGLKDSTSCLEGSTLLHASVPELPGSLVCLGTREFSAHPEHLQPVALTGASKLALCCAAASTQDDVLFGAALGQQPAAARHLCCHEQTYAAELCLMLRLMRSKNFASCLVGLHLFSCDQVLQGSFVWSGTVASPTKPSCIVKLRRNAHQLHYFALLACTSMPCHRWAGGCALHRACSWPRAQIQSARPARARKAERYHAVADMSLQSSSQTPCRRCPTACAWACRALTAAAGRQLQCISAVLGLGLVRHAIHDRLQGSRTTYTVWPPPRVFARQPEGDAHTSL